MKILRQRYFKNIYCRLHEEADSAEDTLTQNGIDYALISLEPYTRMFFGTERKGIAFYAYLGKLFILDTFPNKRAVFGSHNRRAHLRF